MSEDMRERYAEDLRETIRGSFAPQMRIGLQDAELFDEPGGERVEEWITYITRWVTEAVSPEMEQLRELTATCTCYDGNPANYEGPRADCPVHGAVRAFSEERAENERLRAELTEVTGQRDIRRQDCDDLAEQSHERLQRALEAEARIERVRTLHSAEPGQHPDFCWHDKHELPCPTLIALDGLCPRCRGSRFEPGTEEEGDWVPGAARHLPYTGEPCTACHGTGSASETLGGES